MSKPLQLVCTQDHFESLHADLDRVRSTSATVKVSKAALTKLRLDHSRLINAVHDCGVETKEQAAAQPLV